MGDNTTIQFTGDTADLQRKMDRMDKTNLRMIKRYREMAKEGKKSGDVMKRSYRGSAEKLQVLNRVIAQQEKLIKNSGKASLQAGKRLKAWRMQSKALERQLNRTTVGVKYLSSETNRLSAATSKTSRSAKDLGRTSNRMTQGITRGVGGIITQWVGVAGAIRIATMAMNAHYEQQDRRSTATRGFEDKFTELLTLGGNAQNVGALRKNVLKTSVGAGVDPGEISDLWYAMQSNAAGVKAGRIPGMVGSAAKIKRMLPRVETADIGTIYGKIASIQPGLSDKELSNITMYAIERAGVKNAAEVGGSLPKALAGGLIGKVGVRDSSAMFSFLSRRTGGPARAAMGSQQIFRKVMLAEGDDSETLRRMAAGVSVDKGKRKGILGRKELLTEAGVSESDNAMQRLDKLAARNSRKAYSASELKGLFGERAMGHAVKIFGNYPELQEERRLFSTETAQGKDIAGLKMARILRDPMQAQVQMQRVSDVRKTVNQQQMAPMVLKSSQDILKELQAGSEAGGFRNMLITASDKVSRFAGISTSNTEYVDDVRRLRELNIKMQSRAAQAQAEAGGGQEYGGEMLTPVGPAAGGSSFTGSEKVDRIIDAIGASPVGSPNTHTESVAGGAN